MIKLAPKKQHLKSQFRSISYKIINKKQKSGLQNLFLSFAANIVKQNALNVVEIT